MKCLGSLPVEFFKKIPNYTFTRILLNNYNSFAIEEKNYILEKHPPIQVNETKYVNLMINNKNGISFGGCTYKTKTQNNTTCYDSDIFFRFNDYYVEEKMHYNGHKKCEHCNVWNYKLHFSHNSQIIKHTEDYCGQMMLLDYRVDKKIKTFYHDFEKVLQKEKKLE